MREWIALAAVETFKLGKRRDSWILLGMLALILIFHARGLRTELLDYRQAEMSGVGRFGQPLPPDVARSTAVALTRRMTFPGSLDELWLITDWGIVAVLILSALQTGEEFEGGTVRTVLMRGGSRRVWPAAKVAAVVGWAGLAWLVLAILNLAAGSWTQFQAVGLWSLPPSFEQIGSYALRLLRSWLATIPYAAFAVAVAVAARGAGPALVLGLGARFVEVVSTVLGTFLISTRSFGVPALDLLYRIWSSFHVLSLDWNARAWSNAAPAMWLAAVQSTPSATLPDPFQTGVVAGGVVLLIWSVVWAALAGVLLHRRDIGG